MNRFLDIFSENNRFYPLLITLNVILSTFLCVCSAVSTTIANTAIQGELALSNTQSIWLTTLYMLGINTTVPTGNWVANRFGQKRVYTIGVAIFGIGSLLAALAKNFTMIALARLIEGIGAGFIFPVGLALLFLSLPKERLAIAINAYFALAFGCGLGIGIVLCGFLTQFHTWRLLFGILTFVTLPLIVSCWESRPKIPEIHKDPFDFWGFFFFISFIVTLLIALTLGPIPSTNEGWRTPYILALFLFAAISLFFFFFLEKKNPAPLFPFSLFKDPIFTLSLAAMFLLGMATFAGVSLSVSYMLHGLSYDKFTAGKVAAIYGITIGTVSMLTNFLSKKIPIPFLTFPGLFCLSFSYFYNNELSFLTGASQVIAILVLRGIGIGLALGPTTLLALYGITPEARSSAATILTLCRQLGGTYGGTLLSIFSIRQTIFHTARFSEQVNDQLPGYRWTLHRLYDQFPDLAYAKALIVENILTQAYIQGLNDAQIVFGYVTAILTSILCLFVGYRFLKLKRSSTAKNP